ncbi:uncharacterized protein [Dermacentor albipictus]|uniref:uncharacterized protein isoform X2 n=1 Tax=Dermacentor albipictus TaxID=60249 RepID=UPI0038FD00C4
MLLSQHLIRSWFQELGVQLTHYQSKWQLVERAATSKVSARKDDFLIWGSGGVQMRTNCKEEGAPGNVIITIPSGDRRLSTPTEATPSAGVCNEESHKSGACSHNRNGRAAPYSGKDFLKPKGACLPKELYRETLLTETSMKASTSAVGAAHAVEASTTHFPNEVCALLFSWLAWLSTLTRDIIAPDVQHFKPVLPVCTLYAAPFIDMTVSAEITPGSTLRSSVTSPAVSCINSTPVPFAFSGHGSSTVGMALNHYVFTSQQSLDTSIQPSQRKIGKVVPLRKSGNKNLTANYRPISLSSTCCKLLEHIFFKHLVNFLESNAIFTPAQHGFIKTFSCETQLPIFTHKLHRILDRSSFADCIFLDFAKAFDKVCHKLLLYKLSQLNLDTNILKWIECFLSNRSHFVTANGITPHFEA